jgi:D-glycero-alpha-D-manno-heptose 1-phosphate guanylyltransferase
MVTTAIILAGGLGTRLKIVNPILPKPLAPINGHPFLEYLFDYWMAQGISKFILSVGYQSQSIIDHFGQNYRGVGIEYVIENSPLGTGGALLLSAKGLTEPFLILNGDTFFEVDLKDLFSFHEKNNSDWTISLFKTNNVKRYTPLSVSPSGRITNIKTKENRSVCFANGGTYLINPSALKKMNKPINVKISLEEELLPELLLSGHALYGLECFGDFIDIGVPEDYFRATSFFMNHNLS